MIRNRIVKTIGAAAAIGALALAGMFVSSPRARGDDDSNESKVQIGFRIAPVPLHLEGTGPGTGWTWKLRGEHGWLQRLPR
jgi:hypothetical protein